MREKAIRIANRVTMKMYKDDEEETEETVSKESDLANLEEENAVLLGFGQIDISEDEQLSTDDRRIKEKKQENKGHTNQKEKRRQKKISKEAGKQQKDTLQSMYYSTS